MTNTLKLVMAQLNFRVGDIEANTTQVIEQAEYARDALAADIVVFPELALTGYPPEDLLLRPSMKSRMDEAAGRLQGVTGIDLVVGMPVEGENGLENCAVVFRDGQRICQYAKRHLPNYQVFDEKRYFAAGRGSSDYQCQGVRISLAVCEDMWYSSSSLQAVADSADLILSLNASPFHTDKHTERLEVVRQRCRESGLPAVYTNLVGGQDELVFDGGSFAVNADGEVAVRADSFQPGMYTVEFDKESKTLVNGTVADDPQPLEQVYKALVTGVGDYVNKCGFRGVVLGLSGGIDSALSLAIAVDALGPDRVRAVMMPYHYTSRMSHEDAEEQANTLGVDYSVIPIEPMFKAFMGELDGVVKNGAGAMEENLQSRCRGVLLMAISNSLGYMVLTTGNKSEMAVGYATLYGDMCGGYNGLKDVTKTLVYRLARYRNTLGSAIPQRVIDRPPSAELAPGQCDQDSLPPYDLLDPIIESYIEQDMSAEAIVAAGFDRDTVYRVVSLIDRSEFKRRQAVIGARVTRRGFGRDRRYPVCNGWKPGE